MKKVLLIPFLLAAVSVQAQQKVHHQALYWIRYQNQWALSPHWYWINEGDNRRFFSPHVENQLILHSHLHYKINAWDFGAGLTLSWVYAQNPDIGYEHAAAEIRPFLEATHETKINKVFFQNRIRMDNRFLETDHERGIWDHSYYVTRFRYRAQLRLILRRKDATPTVGFRLADEIMLNTKRNTFDQNRIYTSFDFVIHPNFTVELGYVNVYAQQLSRNEYVSRHILRLSVLHRI